MLAFSRRQHLQPQTLDVNALVCQFEPLIRRAVGESIGFEVALWHEPLVCEVDPSELEFGAAQSGGEFTRRDAERPARSRLPSIASSVTTISSVRIAWLRRGHG